MRFMILSADYPRFLRDLYSSQPGLAEQPYAVQMEARNNSLFGVADFYSRNFKAHGHEAAEFHINNGWLQHAWARENGLDILPLEPSPERGEKGGASVAPSAPDYMLQKARRLARPLKPVLKPMLGPAI